MKDKKILLVIGASSDMGAAMIEKVAADYDKVIAHYNSSTDKVDALKNLFGDKIIPLKCDLSSEDDVQSFIEEIKSQGLNPDHIVHFAAPKMFNKQFKKMGWSEFDDGIKTSLRSIVLILEEFVPAMAKQKYGKVVFVLTTCVCGEPPKYKSSYVTVKYALLGLMKALSAEYKDKGITVNGVSPDMVETKFLSELPDLIKEQAAAESVLGRILTPEDVVPTFAYLLSDAADDVSGENFIVDGSTI